MRPVLVNGIGCLTSGTRTVLRGLMRGFPQDVPVVVVLPSGNREDVEARRPNLRVIALNHRVFGRWLRPLFESAVWLAGKCGAFSRIVNLSHYGLCPGGPYVLYFHNRLLIETGNDEWSGRGGRPNRFKRWCLDSCLRRAEHVIVQTDYMADVLRDYAASRGLEPRRVEVLEPLPDASRLPPAAPKRHAFQFFYPTAPFTHKHMDLAVRAILAAHELDPRVGLVITSEPLAGLEAPAVTYSGTLPHDAALAIFGSSDALLYTSSLETLGLPLLEAMLFGLPAVLPRLEYAQAIYGEAGVYYEGDRVEAVRDAVLACVREADRRRALTVERREQVWRDRISWKDHWPRFGVVS